MGSEGEDLENTEVTLSEDLFFFFFLFLWSLLILINAGLFS